MKKAEEDKRKRRKSMMGPGGNVLNRKSASEQVESVKRNQKQVDEMEIISKVERKCSMVGLKSLHLGSRARES